jgi:AP2-associated kinase
VLQAGNVFKLCDFGSATTKTYFPKDSSSINYIEDEINRYTTMAYRSPEMIDLWRHQLINEKVDIWVSILFLLRK